MSTPLNRPPAPASTAAPRPLALSALARSTTPREPTIPSGAIQSGRRYLFEQDFASPHEAARTAARLAAQAPEPEVITPSFTAEELAEARAEGLAEGRASGAAEARNGIEARIAGALETVATRLGEAARASREAAEAAAGATAAATLDLVATALPAIAAGHALPSCEALAESMLARLGGVERIAIRLPPELARSLEPRLQAAAAAADFAGKLDVIATDGMVAGEMRISWPGGDARRDPAALTAAAQEVLRTLGLTSPAYAEQTENGNGD